MIADLLQNILHNRKGNSMMNVVPSVKTIAVTDRQVEEWKTEAARSEELATELSSDTSMEKSLRDQRFMFYKGYSAALSNVINSLDTDE
jgi:peroxiredoxin